MCVDFSSAISENDFDDSNFISMRIAVTYGAYVFRSSLYVFLKKLTKKWKIQTYTYHIKTSDVLVIFFT